jgi:hypothetical protein
MPKTPRLILAAALAGALAAGCTQSEQTAQAIYAPPASSPNAVVSGASTPDMVAPGHTYWPSRSGLNGDPDNPSGAPGPGITTGIR